LDQKCGRSRVNGSSNQPGIVGCAVGPLMGRWTLRMVGLLKLTRSKVQPNKKRFRSNEKKRV